MKPKLPALPHPATFLGDCPQLHTVIRDMEADAYPLPDDAVWRCDLPQPLAIRLARATGATSEQIEDMVRQDQAELRARQGQP